MIPEEKLGILVFTNTDANAFYESLKLEIRDAFLKLPYRNYSAVMLARQKMNDAADEFLRSSIRQSMKNGSDNDDD